MSDVASLASVESPIMGARYLSAVALSCLLYDHLTHFDEELTDVWLNLRQRTWLKVMFLCGRYIAEVFVVYSAVVMGGFDFQLQPQDCRTYVLVSTLCFKISLIATEGVVIYRMRSLWDFNRHVTLAILAMFIFVLVALFMAMGFEVARLPDFFTAFRGFPECLFVDTKPGPIPYMLMWATVLVVWDIFNIVLFTSNLFASPYQCPADVLKRFKRDGGRYFVCLFFIRSLHLFMSAFGEDSRMSTLPLACALSVIVNGRIFHRIGRDFERDRKAEVLNILI